MRTRGERRTLIYWAFLLTGGQTGGEAKRKEGGRKEGRGQGGDAFGPPACLSVCLAGGVIDLGFL